MSSCLGLYIEENLIKYAKVSKEQEQIKVESFGIKFYEKIGEAISQIIEETYSQKTPISINLSEEMYNYFDMFALLTKNDLQKAIKTEFESYCSDKGYNPNVFETRYAVSGHQSDTEKIKIIHIAENKIELNKRMQQVDGYKLTNVSPVSVSIPNLKKVQEKENSVIINIEDKTTVTTIIGGRIYHIDTIDEGSTEILSKINRLENSYSKAYEICKNTTIYTSEGKELQEYETTYLEYIMPTLYNIVGESRKIINQAPEKIEKAYITGSMALINNIDLYFQEYFLDVECEILKPFFVTNTKDISTKDYIEVNSAISLALMGLGEGIQGMNFKKMQIADKLPDWIKIDVKKKPKDKQTQSNLFTWDFGQQLDKVEIGLIRGAVGVLMLILIYSSFSILLGNQIQKKDEETQNSINNTNTQIQLAKNDSEKIRTKTNEYTTMIKNLQDLNDKIMDRAKTKNAIPNLLNQIMFIIPENVQIVSIQNTTGRHIYIDAISNKYEQLGYLKAKIKSDMILTNVISTAGQKDDNVVTVRIEGDLP